MARYLCKRCLLALVALGVIITGTFLLMHVIPGNPFLTPKLLPSIRENLSARYGLDLPIWQQYLVYWGNLLHGHLGWSLVDPGRSVGQMISAGFPVSAELGAEALLWSISFGIALGLVAAFHLNRAWDYAALGVVVLGLAVPNFVIAVLGDYFLGVQVRLLPVAGWGTFAQSVLPAISLGLPSLALVGRLVRAQGAEVLEMDYIRTARAKGLPWPQILAHHVLRNAILPIVTILGPLAATVLTGSFVVERIFAIPGLGSAFVSSVLDRDYPLILGLTIFYATLLLGFNLLVDVLYTLVDPRIRLGQEGR